MRRLCEIILFCRPSGANQPERLIDTSVSLHRRKNQIAEEGVHKIQGEGELVYLI